MSEQVVVDVKDVKKTFRIPLEASTGIKQKLINYLKGRKGYREFSPLNGISFQIEEGDFFGIVGRNGSGKSTLLKTIAGIYSPTEGSVNVKGTLVPFIELGVGFNPELTGRENIFLNGALLGFSHKEMEAMYDEIVDFAELPDFMEERLKNYSSGMQVRLAFSIAIRAQGDILLLDEVLAVGDEAFQKKCFDYFESLKDSKKTVIFVSHDMSAVQRFCTKALIIEKGAIKLIGSPVDIADEYRQENITPIPDNKSGLKHSNSEASLLMKVGDGEDEVSIDFTIQSSVEVKDCYIGFTLFKDGASIAEINSLSQEGSHNLTYHLDKTNLNPGIYEVTSALFKRKDKTLITLCGKRQSFLVKGYDETRGGGMKLESNWTASK